MAGNLGKKVEQDGSDPAALHAVLDQKRDLSNLRPIDGNVASHRDDLLVRSLSMNNDQCNVPFAVDLYQLIEKRVRQLRDQPQKAIANGLWRAAIEKLQKPGAVISAKFSQAQDGSVPLDDIAREIAPFNCVNVGGFRRHHFHKWFTRHALRPSHREIHCLFRATTRYTIISSSRKIGIA